MKKRISTILAISTAFILFYSSISHAQEIDLKKIRELESVTQDLLNNKYNPTSESNMGCFAHDSSSTGQFSLNPKKK